MATIDKDEVKHSLLIDVLEALEEINSLSTAFSLLVLSATVTSTIGLSNMTSIGPN